jgi:hypothetical protein
VTGFTYGWQKTVQFSGLFVAAAVPAAAIDALWRYRPETAVRRRVTNAVLAALVLFVGYATVMNCRDIYKWSNRKVISNDWFALRDQSRGALRNAPVLVDSATFRMAFFHGMWAAYFMPESLLYFGGRGVESGGYLRNYVINEAAAEIPPPAAVLVGRPWADTLDANSPRILTGREYALVQRSNRVHEMAGFSWPSGSPDRATGKFSLQIVPHTASDLVLELAPLSAEGWPAAEWRVQRSAAGEPQFAAAVTGASPWLLRIPLVAGKPNDVSVMLAGASDPNALSFLVSKLRVENRP